MVLGKKLKYFEKCDPQPSGKVFCRVGFKDPDSDKVVAVKEGYFVPTDSGTVVERHREEGDKDLIKELRERWEQLRKEGFKIIPREVTTGEGE